MFKRGDIVMSKWGDKPTDKALVVKLNDDGETMQVRYWQYFVRGGFVNYSHDARINNFRLIGHQEVTP
jgi:hypothetical protein